MNNTTLKNKLKKTVCLDFDGTLYTYESGWISPPDYLPDPPVKGAAEWCHEASKHFNLVISSARAQYPGVKDAMEKWLEKWGFPKIPVVTEKPLAFAYVDDRGITFKGTFPSIDELRNFRTWQE